MTFAGAELAVVRAVAQWESIGGAARSLGIAQPSASVRLQGLERRLGTVLFERTATGTVLTAAGRRFLPFAERILDLADEAAAAAGVDESPRIRVGVHGAFAPAVVPTVAATTARAGVGFDVVDAHSPELIQLVDDRAVDLAVVVPSPAPASVRLVPLGDDPVVCVVRADHALARRRASVADLANHPIAVAAWGQPQHELRSLLVRAGARPDALRDVATAATAVTLARVAGDVAIVPRSTVAAELSLRSLAMVRVSDLPRWTSPLLAAHHSDAGDLVAAVVRAMRRHLTPRGPDA